MDKCSDADFDSYWEYESRNKNRNRIRVGRQYQASVPPLLKPGEKDTRRCEDLETLKWKPDKLSDQCVDQYLSMAKAISRFARAIDPSLVPEKAVDTPMQTALKGLSEFVTSHHPCHHDAGCQVPNPQLSGECSTKHISSSEWTPNETQLFAQALEVCGKNFCAIKKDFLPWKPVRSLIEYYYQGKSEKPESPNPADLPGEDLDSKVEKSEPVGSCSEDSPNEVLEPKLETKELPEASPKECKTEVTEDVPCMQNLKVEESEEKSEEMKPVDSSTVGSLKFYLGGRLVLKLNAQQYSDPGSKCHWVPSNDTPKRPQLIKRVKHKKKMYQESSSVGYQVHSGRPENSPWDSPDVTECDVVIAKRAKLKADYESSSEPETSCPLLYSTSWTPPVANGPDVVEMDDGSSKTSEGCLSPVQVNSLGETSEVKCEVSGGGAAAVNSSSLIGNFGDPSDINETKPQHEHVRVKSEPFPGTCNTSQSETSSNNSNTIQGANLKTEKSLPNPIRDGSFSQEVQNNQMCTKNMCSTDANNLLCFLPPSAVSCSPSKKQWYRWASSPSADNFESSKVRSPNSISQTSRQTVEDSPLDLSSKTENILQEIDVQKTVPIVSTIASNFHKDKKMCPSPLKEEVQLSCNKTTESGPNVPLSSSDSFTVDEDTKVRTCKTEENKTVSKSSGEKNSEKCTKNEDNFSSLSEKNLDEKNKNSNDFSYPYYNLPCSCSSPKCTSSFALNEHMCNKDGIECLKGNSDYLLPVTNRTAPGKPPPWLEASVATYLQYYPQCYPYYLTYGVSPSSVTGSSVTELPLDLSSTCENSRKEENVQHNVPEKETSVTPNSAEALEKGMLYHLLKNRNSK